MQVVSVPNHSLIISHIDMASKDFISDISTHYNLLKEQQHASVYFHELNVFIDYSSFLIHMKRFVCTSTSNAQHQTVHKNLLQNL